MTQYVIFMALALFIYDYGLLVVGAVVLFRNTVLNHKLYRRQTAWLIMGIVLPLIVHFTYIAKLVPGWTKDFSSIAGALGGFCFSIGCLRHRLFAVVPISRQTILQQMQIGIIITDASGTIIDLNESACVMVGKSDITLLGSPGGRIEAWPFELHEHRSLPQQQASPEAPPLELPSESPILSLGELRVVEMLAQNLSNKEIADRLGVSANTVKFHLANVYKKTGAHSRAELIYKIGDVIAGKRA